MPMKIARTSSLGVSNVHSSVPWLSLLTNIFLLKMCDVFAHFTHRNTNDVR